MSTNATTRRLSGTARKRFLVVHIVSAGLWFGVDIALGILVLTALLTDDPHTAGTALQAVPMFAIWPMFVASLATLASGVVLALGSRHGLLKYWWVAAKLAINVLMSALIVVALRPGVNEAAVIGRRLVAGDAGVDAPTGLLFPVFVAPTLLLIAYLLSVFKPQVRIRRRHRPPASADVGAEPPREVRAARSRIGV